jgi:DNA (cytosine-5)-methyltransferase 1
MSLHKTPTRTETVGEDFLSGEARSALMRRIRSVGNRIETQFSRALVDGNFTFETNVKYLPGKPDFVFRSKQLAVFIDGEFWHGGQWRQRQLTSLEEQFPSAEKRERWVKKIRKNINRDIEHTEALLTKGWRVIRFWAGDVEANMPACIEMVREGLTQEILPNARSLIPRRHVAEFFSGIGLVRMGLESDGWKIKFANDHSPDKIAFYKNNFAEIGDIVDARDVYELSSKDIPTVTLSTASFPCTDLSLAGSQKGLEPGTESSAYLKFTNLLTELSERRPPFVLLENVVGMIHSREGRDFRICLEKLGDAGYTVDPIILDAKSFVPQSRPRLFVIAVRNDFIPKGHLGADQIADLDRLRPPQLTRFISAHPDLPWSLRPLPDLPKRTKSLTSILETIPRNDPRWWSTERATKLLNQMSERHRSVVKAMKSSKRAKYGTVFRRMRNGKSMAEIRTDGLAGCLRTPKGGSARQILFRASNGKYAVRLFTPIECARLMGAEDIKIPNDASVNSALYAFGDAVCVPVIRWISEHYLTPLASELIRGCILSPIEVDRKRSI